MRALKGDEHDPKGLIAEAYRMDGITAGECRSIFLDWALSYSGDTKSGLTVLLQRHGDEDHPMTEVLRDGLTASDRPKRRGGWRGRARP